MELTGNENLFSGTMNLAGDQKENGLASCLSFPAHPTLPSHSKASSQFFLCLWDGKKQFGSEV
jgi:hypothetical protein